MSLDLLSTNSYKFLLPKHNLLEEEKMQFIYVFMRLYQLMVTNAMFLE